MHNIIKLCTIKSPGKYLFRKARGSIHIWTVCVQLLRLFSCISPLCQTIITMLFDCVLINYHCESQFLQSTQNYFLLWLSHYHSQSNQQETNPPLEKSHCALYKHRQNVKYRSTSNITFFSQITQILHYLKLHEIIIILLNILFKI